MTQPTAIIPLPTPICLARETDVVPHAYIIMRHESRCLGCNTSHEWSEIYALNRLTSRLALGKYVDHLVPVTRLQWRVPLHHRKAPLRITPCCHECASEATVAHLLPPPIPDALSPQPQDSSPMPVRPKNPRRRPLLDLLGD